MKKYLWIPAAILFPTLLFFHWHKNHKQHSTANAIPVEVVQIKKMHLPNRVTATGILVPNQSTTITSKVNGYITKIYYQEGSLVQANTPLIQLDNRQDLDTLSAAEANSQLSNFEFQRNQKLLAQGLITQDIYFSSKVTAQQNAAAVVTDQDQLQLKTIAAPFTGIVGERTLSIGDYVQAGNPLTTIVDSSSLRIEYNLPAMYQNELALGQTVALNNSINPSQKIIAKVTYVSPVIDDATQTIKVHAVVDNQQNLLKAGGYVTVSQDLGATKMSLMLPSQCVLSEMNGYCVYLIKNNTAIKQTVTIGRKTSSMIEIKNGLAGNSVIVLAGQERLTDGAAVRIVGVRS